MLACDDCGIALMVIHAFKKHLSMETYARVILSAIKNKNHTLMIGVVKKTKPDCFNVLHQIALFGDEECLELVLALPKFQTAWKHSYLQHIESALRYGNYSVGLHMLTKLNDVEASNVAMVILLEMEQYKVLKMTLVLFDEHVTQTTSMLICSTLYAKKKYRLLSQIIPSLKGLSTKYLQQWIVQCIEDNVMSLFLYLTVDQKIELPNDDGARHLLEHACANDQQVVVKYLLNDVGVDSQRTKALELVIQCKNIPIMMLLLKGGHVPTPHDLSLACAHENLVAVSKFLSMFDMHVLSICLFDAILLENTVLLKKILPHMNHWTISLIRELIEMCLKKEKPIALTVLLQDARICDMLDVTNATHLLNQYDSKEQLSVVLLQRFCKKRRKELKKEQLVY
jgi:hypothetical protein